MIHEAVKKVLKETRDKKWTDWWTESGNIVDYLESMGLTKGSESERWLTYEYKGEEVVALDFDPWMHIDSDDDEIDYLHPVYVYVGRSTVSNMIELKARVEEILSEIENGNYSSPSIY